MKERPIAVTVICWFLLVSSVLSLIVCSIGLFSPRAIQIMEKSPIPVSVQIILMYVGIGVTFTSSTAMLKGKNWGRMLYAIWGTIGFLIGVLSSPIKMTMIPSMIIFIIIVFFLFTHKARSYFTMEGATDDIKGN